MEFGWLTKNPVQPLPTAIKTKAASAAVATSLFPQVGRSLDIRRTPIPMICETCPAKQRLNSSRPHSRRSPALYQRVTQVPLGLGTGKNAKLAGNSLEGKRPGTTAENRPSRDHLKLVADS